MDEERLRAMIREELEPACRQVAALEKETRSLFQWMMALNRKLISAVETVEREHDQTRRWLHEEHSEMMERQDPEEVRTFRYFNATQVLKRRDLETEEIIRRLRQRGYYVRPDRRLRRGRKGCIIVVGRAYR